MRLLTCLLLLLVTCGCTRSADLQAEENRQQELRKKLQTLKESVKDLPMLMAQVEDLQKQKSQLLKQRNSLKKGHSR